MKKKGSLIAVIVVLFVVALVLLGLYSLLNNANVYIGEFFGRTKLNILSSYDNEYMEDSLKKYADTNKIDLEFTYMGDIAMVDEINNNSTNYDAIWISNSMWLYMLNNSSIITDKKSISVSPVIFGIKKSKAQELGLVDKEVTNSDMLELIKNGKLKYVMPSVTNTNSGAVAYLGFLNSLAGSPDVLTEEMLDDEELLDDIKSLFSGVERVSGDESYLESMFINGEDYDSVIASESSLININKKLNKKGKEELYFIYPVDGVGINDSTFGFINNDSSKEDSFLKLEEYLLSDECREELNDIGVRTWYGGVSNESDSNVFRSEWGIDTSKSLNVSNFPSKKVINKAINIYIEKLRKPTHVVFCLDYSGSMSGDGINELRSAMDYILDYEKASGDRLQFSENDKITVITFSSNVSNVWDSDSGIDTSDLIYKINNFTVAGSTALYDAVIEGLEVLDKDSDEYTKTIIAMTDGGINVGTFSSLNSKYKIIGGSIPIYSIMFGDADESQLTEIAKLSNAKVFDGRTDLLKAFKEVRSYN